jgi:hypothetical protein
LSGVLPHDTRSYSALCGDSLPQDGPGLTGFDQLPICEDLAIISVF